MTDRKQTNTPRKVLYVYLAILAGVSTLLLTLLISSLSNVPAGNSYGKRLYHYEDRSGQSKYLPRPLNDSDELSGWAFKGQVSVFAQIGYVSIFGQNPRLKFLASGRRLWITVAGDGFDPNRGYTVPQANQAGLGNEIEKILSAINSDRFLTSREKERLLLASGNQMYIDYHMTGPLFRVIAILICFFLLASASAHGVVALYKNVYLVRRRISEFACSKCGYSMSDESITACPECGTEHATLA